MMQPKTLFLASHGRGYRPFVREDTTCPWADEPNTQRMTVRVQARLWLWSPLLAPPQLDQSAQALDLATADVISLR